MSQKFTLSSAYDADAPALAALYESVPFEFGRDWLLDLLPGKPGLVLDIGAGSGRDAAWFAERGHEVVAVEPSAGMRSEGQRLHPHSRIRWLHDSLPGLETTLRLNLSFDVILLSAVWMHVLPADRPRAFRKIVTLLNPGGLIALTLRHGPSPAGRPMHPTSLQEIETLARSHGALVICSGTAKDSLGRADVSWSHVALRLPDDGTGALPLLRHVILNDAKSSTYKLGLLRAVARIADASGGMARDAGDDHISLPLGLVALYWLRLFKPLIAHDLPQTPTNRRGEGLGFVRSAFHALMPLSHLDLRIGLRFSGETATALHQALKDVAQTVASMPATYMTYPNSDGPIMRAQRHGRPHRRPEIILDEPYLRSLGELLVPRHLWRALARFNAWIEPAIIAEWMRLMRAYAERQGRRLDSGALVDAMEWSEPGRDVGLARQIAMRMLQAGHPVYCVWSGKRLRDERMDIDHCFPWSAWPCDDLWNLMPTDRMVNQRQKRQLLVSAATLTRSQNRIVDWWASAYVDAGNDAVTTRFFSEAKGTLPLITDGPNPPNLEDVFGGVLSRRIVLKQDQQLKDWEE